MYIFRTPVQVNKAFEFRAFEFKSLPFAGGSGRESVPLEQSEHTSSYLRVSKEEPSNMMAASKTEDYQLLGEVLDQGLKELGYSREDLSVELFASDKQHVLDLYWPFIRVCFQAGHWLLVHVRRRVESVISDYSLRPTIIVRNRILVAQAIGGETVRRKMTGNTQH